jgi:hypothetical protein
MGRVRGWLVFGVVVCLLSSVGWASGRGGFSRCFGPRESLRPTRVFAYRLAIRSAGQSAEAARRPTFVGGRASRCA